MAREKKKREDKPPQLEMTPMIDVVFQLLIFFIVTLKQEDILSHLDVTRPAPDPNAKPERQPDLLEIMVYRGGFVLQGRNVTARDLENNLTRLASYSKTMSVIIKCTGDSPHEFLVQALDLCSKAGLKNLAVFSM
jgi:biopolymer transport protein ExbD